MTKKLDVDDLDVELDCCHRLGSTQFVLAERERELLALKGSCSNSSCRLHRAHSGPCDVVSEGRR